MLTINKIRLADCDITENDSEWAYVVCEDFDIQNAYEQFETEEEAENWIEENK
ncbi:MAG: hypothetical protein PHW65_04610 [Dehalococcoidales bacterium]|nr:hypothetical protein [Dehalococcoidales bacterium]